MDKPRQRTVGSFSGLWLLVTALATCGTLNGCAALSNPIINGVPVRRLDPNFLGDPREDKKTIPLNLLRQKPPDEYRLAAGDVLGVWLEPGIFSGPADPAQPAAIQAPPVQISQLEGGQPALGYPVPVLDGGDIFLPIVNRVRVEGLTIPEAREAIIRAYTVDKQVIRPERIHAIVTLFRKRTYQILVIRQDSGGLTIGSSGVIGDTKRGTGAVVNLPAYENDVLSALAKTGGLPGLDAMNEVVIERGPAQGGQNPAALLDENGHLAPGCLAPGAGMAAAGGQFVRIPLRMRPDESVPFRPEDVVLKTGDILFIEARDTEVWYSGGLLPPSEHVLPRDRDLDVVEAIGQAGFQVISGGVTTGNLSGSFQSSGIGSPPPSLVSIVRRTPGNREVVIRVDLNQALRDPRERVLIQPGDILILQETPQEAFARYFLQKFNFSAFYTLFKSSRSQGTASISLP